jgi:hypothetical protein
VLERSRQVLVPLDTGHVVTQGSERRTEVVDPGPLGLAVADSGRVVELRVLHLFELFEPLLAGGGGPEPGDDLVGLTSLLERRGDAELDGSAGEAAELGVRPVKDDVDTPVKTWNRPERFARMVTLSWAPNCVPRPARNLPPA